MKIILRFFAKKIVVFLAILMCGSFFGQVTLPHYDGFNYAVGDLGSKGNWVNFNGASGDRIQVGGGNLSYLGMPLSTGGKVLFDGTGIDNAKAFTAQTVGFGTIYYSFLINVSSLTGFTTGGYHAGIADNGSGFSSTLWLRPSPNSGFYNIGLGGRTALADVQWGADRDLNTTYFVVVSLQSILGGITGAGNDTCKMWINPVYAEAEPNPTLSLINSTNSDLTSISRIFFRQGSATDTPFVELDELRVGFSWESVTGGIVWTGTAWSNVAGPTATTDASIDGVYDTAVNGPFSVKNLTLSAGSLGVKSGTNINVLGYINNKLSADKFIIENNANLVQTAVATNTGDITVRRNTNIKRLDYTYWSSPVVGQTLANLSPGTLPNRFYSLNNANTFVSVASNTAMTAATGFSVRAPNNFATTPSLFTANFIGKPNNGQQTVSFTSTGAEYILLGNPYPSTVSATSFLASNPGSLHFWTHSVYQGGSANYATFTTLGTAATIAGAIGGAPNGTIQIGQGFMYLPQSGDTFAVFENSMRIGNNDNQFFRSATAPQDKMWLNLTSDQNSFSQILVGYVPNATTGFDPSIDAKQINTDGSVFYSFSENEKLSVQGRPGFTPTDVVQLGFTAAGAGNYKLSIDHLEGDFATNQDIFVKDNFVNAVHNLKHSDYLFASTQGTFDSRFELVYQSPLNNVANVLTENSIIMSAKDNVLSINSGNSTMTNIQIFDLQGRMIIERDNINSNIAIIDAGYVRNQVVLVKVISSHNKLVTKKVIF